MNPKKQRASSGEKMAIALGAAQVGIANGLKGMLDNRLAMFSDRDDSGIHRAKANAGSNSATRNALATAPDASSRALVLAGANQGLAQANTSATATAAGSHTERMKTAIGLRFGAQDGVAGSVLSTANAQNNSAATITNAKVQNQAATIGAIGNAIGTYGVVKANNAVVNAHNKNTAATLNQPEYDQVGLFGGTKKVKVGG